MPISPGVRWVLPTQFTGEVEKPIFDIAKYPNGENTITMDMANVGYYESEVFLRNI